MKRQLRNIISNEIFWVILLTIIALLLTYILSPGKYETEVIQGASGNQVILDGSTYHKVAGRSLHAREILQAFSLGFITSFPMLFFLFLATLATAIIEATGTIQGVLGFFTSRFKTSQMIFIPGSMILFGFLGAALGMEEALLPFIPLYVALTLSLGYDSLTGAAIVLCGASAGFTTSLTNPFTVIVAQEVLDLPLYSGFFFRTILFVVFLLTSIRFVMRHGSRVIEDPRKSPMHELDQVRDKVEAPEFTEWTRKKAWVLLLLFLAMLILPLIAALLRWNIGVGMVFFTLLSLFSAFLGGLQFQDFLTTTRVSISRFLPLFILVGLSRSIPFILEKSLVLHTLIHQGAMLLSPVSSNHAALIIYAMQSLINIFIPTGTGQVVFSLPILGPMGDLLGVTRQTNVLAFQLGDGITNILSPISFYLMAGLSSAKIPWKIWAKWVLPLILIFCLFGAIFITSAQSIQYGPF